MNVSTNNQTQTPAQVRAFLTIAEAAAEIRATRRFLETRIEDGELTVVRLSKRLIRIRRSELDRWIESFASKRGAA